MLYVQRTLMSAGSTSVSARGHASNSPMIPCTLALCRAQSLPPVLSATITGMLAPCLHMPGGHGKSRRVAHADRLCVSPVRQRIARRPALKPQADDSDSARREREPGGGFRANALISPRHVAAYRLQFGGRAVPDPARRHFRPDDARGRVVGAIMTGRSVIR